MSEEQKPVAWRYKKEGGGWFVSDNEPQYVEQWNDIEEIKPLYTHPAAARQPLTDKQINALQLPESGKGTIRDLVRIIEAAHGIGGNDE